MRRTVTPQTLALTLILGLCPQLIHAKGIGFRPCVIVPQSRAFHTHRGTDPRSRVQLTSVNVGVVIIERASTTTMDIHLSNPGSRRTEAELLVPVPDGAVVRGFAYQGAAKEPTARVLPRDEARRTYEALVARIRDPALLEFAGYNLIRSSVFPIEARGKQTVRLTYEHLLEVDGNRVDYVLPRSGALESKVPWNVSVKIRSKRPVSTVYSPSHALETLRTDAHNLSSRITKSAVLEPGTFRLSYLLEGDGLSASLFAYPDQRVGGGYFLLLAGLPATKTDGETTIQREVTLVLDRSGSMGGEKIAQAKDAALQIIAGLENGESFNVIVYNDIVEPLSASPLVKSDESVEEVRKFFGGIQARGGTNIHAALLEALRQKPSEGKLPLVLFLTDGLPTIGQTSELAIRQLVSQHNPFKRRVFTFGIGLDVNTPLLERIASKSRATATFVLPKENVEVKMARVFRSLSGPVLASPQLEVIDPAGAVTLRRVSELAPPEIPDLFSGDQLTLLGVYKGEEDLRFRLSGNYRGKERQFEFTFALSSATTRHAFVPRLWASRKIGFLEDAIRDFGDSGARSGSSHPAVDPRFKELVDEIVRLSTEFGILSEYTAFLALEGTDLGDKSKVLSEANSNFLRRSVRTRTGRAAVNQDLNRIHQKQQSVLNRRNRYWNEKLESVALSSVRQLANKAFYRRGNRWVDSLIVEREKAIQPSRVIEYGSEEFRSLLSQLIANGQQACVSLRGEILLSVHGETVLVRGPADVPEDGSSHDPARAGSVNSNAELIND